MNQRKIQPFQIEELSLSVGYVRGYAPSGETVRHTLVIRDDEGKTVVEDLVVTGVINGKFDGTAFGKFDGDARGTFEGIGKGKFDGEISGVFDGDSIAAHTLNIDEYARIKKIEGSLWGEFTGTSQGEHYGNFDGVLSGTAYGSLHGNVDGNLRGDTFGLHTGGVVGNVIGDLRGNVFGDIYGNVEGGLKGNVEGELFGNADTATRLKAPITISITGLISGSAEFDGSQSIVINTSINPTHNFSVATVSATNTYFLGRSTTISFKDGEEVVTLAKLLYTNNTPYLNLSDNVLQNGSVIYREGGKTINVEDGGTGVKSITGLIKGNGTRAFTAAIPGTDYLTLDSVSRLQNKAIDMADGNVISNLQIGAFAKSTISENILLSGAGSSTKIPTEKAVKDLVDAKAVGLNWKQAVKCSTTKNINLNSDVAAGKYLDGIVLNLNDRILVKDQDDATTNGIYVITLSRPNRSSDANSALLLNGCAVFVESGTVNGSTGWTCLSGITALGTSNVTFAQFSGTNVYTSGTGISIVGNVISIGSNIVNLEGNQTLRNKTIYGTLIGDVQGSSSSCIGNADTATTATNVNGTGYVNAKTGKFSSTVTWEGGNSTQSNTAYFERHQWDGSATNLDNVSARKSLGLGDMALQSSDSVDITGGVIKGISPLSTEDGGTGVDLSKVEGILKVANGIFTEALPGVDFITKDSTNDILNKVLSGETNKLLNFDLSIFAKGVIDPSPILDEESDYKLATQKAIKTYITDRLAGANWISPVRCASTTNLSILNDLVPGKTIDGVILKAKDRVLLKDQTLAAENGVYIVGGNLTKRSDDLNSAKMFERATVMVLEGTYNSGTSWICNTKDIVEWSTDIIWSLYGVRSYTVGEGLNYKNNAIIPDFDILVGVTEDQKLYNKRLDSSSVILSNLDSAYSGRLQFLLNNNGLVQIVAESTADRKYYLPKGSGRLYGENSQVIPVIDGGTGIGSLIVGSILVAKSKSQFEQITLSDSAKEFLQSDVDTYIKNIAGNKTNTLKTMSLLSTSPVSLMAATPTVLAESLDEEEDIIEESNESTENTYYLSEYQYNQLVGEELTHLHLHSHSDLLNVYGDGDKHLSSSQLELLTKGKSTDLHTHAHNNSKGLQGGFGNEFYHLTRNQYDALIRGVETDIHTHSHDNLSGVQGGAYGEHYHIDAESYRILITRNFGSKLHNDFDNIQGGRENQYYHLSLDKYNQLENFKGIIGEHNDLTDLQGGDSINGEFFHITADEKVFLADIFNKGISHASLIDVLGDGKYHLSLEQLEGLTSGEATTLHRHNEYIRIDGSNRFLSQVEGLTPTKSTHLATKEYVDSVAIGLKWIKSVKSRTITTPSDLTNKTGDRYLVPTNASGDWSGKGNTIAIYSPRTGWGFEEVEENTAVHIEDEGKNFVWNGKDWVLFNASVVRHENLPDLLGGEWHLTADQYRDLTGGDSSTTHYHAADRDLANATGILSVEHGGTGLDGIPTDSIIYASGPNTFAITSITKLARDIIASRSVSDVKRILEYGSMASQDSSDVNITGGSITGIKPLAVEYGGTGATSLTGLIKGNGTGAFTSAIPGTDYLTSDGKAKLSNKSFDAREEGNSISNINLTDFASGVISSDSKFSVVTDERIATQKAIKEYVESLTNGNPNGRHDFISGSHTFNNATTNSILFFTGNEENPVEYRTLESTNTIELVLEKGIIAFKLKTDVVLADEEQTLKNKTLDNVSIALNGWKKAQHTHEDSEHGGQLSDKIFSKPVSVSKGGTGLSEIKENDILVGAKKNQFTTLTTCEFGRELLKSATQEEFANKFNNEIKNVRAIKLGVEDEDTSAIEAKNGLDIKAGKKINIVSDVDIKKTLSISPTIVRYSSDSTSHSLDEVSSSIVILRQLNKDEDLSEVKLEFVLTDPAEVEGKMIYIKNLLETSIIISATNSTIDGDEAIGFDAKYQALTLYSDGEEWMVL